MTDHSKKLLARIEQENPELYNAICPIIVLDRLILYLNYKLTGDESGIDSEIDESLETAKTNDSSAWCMYYDAAILNMARGDLARAETLAKKAKENLAQIANKKGKNEEYLLLQDVYKLRMNECNYFIANINKAYETLETAYSELQKKDDIKKILKELRLEHRVIILGLRANGKHKTEEIKKEDMN